jgi:hypothetical protein
MSRPSIAGIDIGSHRPGKKLCLMLHHLLLSVYCQSKKAVAEDLPGHRFFSDKAMGEHEVARLFPDFLLWCAMRCIQAVCALQIF